MNKTWIEEAMSVFSDSREMNEEESKSYEEVLNKLYKPTGKTFCICSSCQNKDCPIDKIK